MRLCKEDAMLLSPILRQSLESRLHPRPKDDAHTAIPRTISAQAPHSPEPSQDGSFERCWAEGADNKTASTEATVCYCKTAQPLCNAAEGASHQSAADAAMRLLTMFVLVVVPWLYLWVIAGLNPITQSGTHANKA